MSATRQEISATPWNVGGTFMPYSDNPRQNVWSQTPPGAQSGHVVAKDCTPADARLITAAPDLLAAAKSMLAARDGKASLDAVIALRNAIAKAEGRS